MAILRSEISAALAAMLVMVASTTAAQARPVVQLSELLRAQLQRVPQAVDACSLTDQEGDGEWDVTTFFLDVTPYVSVGISTVLQITVTPEFEFIWSRDDGS